MDSQDRERLARIEEKVDQIHRCLFNGGNGLDARVRTVEQRQGYFAGIIATVVVAAEVVAHKFFK